MVPHNHNLVPMRQASKPVDLLLYIRHRPVGSQIPGVNEQVTIRYVGDDPVVRVGQADYADWFAVPGGVEGGAAEEEDEVVDPVHHPLKRGGEEYV